MAKIGKSVTIGGKAINGSITRDPVTEIGLSQTVAAGKSGTLSTRTDNDTGTLTLGVGHGITDGKIVDVYWDGGIRRGMTVGSVSGTSVPVDGGAGDNLPIATTAIIACVQVVLDVDATGNDVIMAAVSAQRRGSVQFQQNDGTVIKSLDLGASSGLVTSGVGANDGEMWDWTDVDADVTNPFAGVSIGKIVISNGSSAGTSKVTIGLGLDNAA